MQKNINIQLSTMIYTQNLKKALRNELPTTLPKNLLLFSVVFFYLKFLFLLDFALLFLCFAQIVLISLLKVNFLGYQAKALCTMYASNTSCLLGLVSRFAIRARYIFVSRSLSLLLLLVCCCCCFFFSVKNR